MIGNAIHTKWKFIVEFENEETGAIEGKLGEAADRDECELLVASLLTFTSSLKHSVARKTQNG
jgi:hypothetical protein